mmetsp:Transcript_2437/g.9610  ORF Transcript_2437/g.9610 Transcript_2437/m.9610 type:complete len:233 (+) Transcript_2437:762-1460(+)
MSIRTMAPSPSMPSSRPTTVITSGTTPPTSRPPREAVDASAPRNAAGPPASTASRCLSAWSAAPTPPSLEPHAAAPMGASAWRMPRAVGRPRSSRPMTPSRAASATPLASSTRATSAASGGPSGHARSAPRAEAAAMSAARTARCMRESSRLAARDGLAACGASPEALSAPPHEAAAARVGWSSGAWPSASSPLGDDGARRSPPKPSSRSSWSGNRGVCPAELSRCREDDRA